MTVYRLACSREFIVVPAARLAARPLQDVVELAIVTTDAEPGDGDWRAVPWVSVLDGTMLGAGMLAGPGAVVLPAGRSTIYVRESLPDGQVRAWAWSRLEVGLAG